MLFIRWCSKIVSTPTSKTVTHISHMMHLSDGGFGILTGFLGGSNGCSGRQCFTHSFAFSIAFFCLSSAMTRLQQVFELMKSIRDVVAFARGLRAVFDYLG